MSKQVVKIRSVNRKTAYTIAQLATRMAEQLQWPVNSTSDVNDAVASAYANMLGSITTAIIQIVPTLARGNNETNKETNRAKMQSVLEDIFPKLGISLEGEYEGALKGTIQQNSNKKSPHKPVYDDNGMYDWEANLQNNIVRRLGGRTPK